MGPGWTLYMSVQNLSANNPPTPADRGIASKKTLQAASVDDQSAVGIQRQEPEARAGRPESKRHKVRKQETRNKKQENRQHKKDGNMTHRVRTRKAAKARSQHTRSKSKKQAQESRKHETTSCKSKIVTARGQSQHIRRKTKKPAQEQGLSGMMFRCCEANVLESWRLQFGG